MRVHTCQALTASGRHVRETVKNRHETVKNCKKIPPAAGFSLRRAGLDPTHPFTRLQNHWTPPTRADANCAESTSSTSQVCCVWGL